MLSRMLANKIILKSHEKSNKIRQTDKLLEVQISQFHLNIILSNAIDFNVYSKFATQC